MSEEIRHLAVDLGTSVVVIAELARDGTTSVIASFPALYNLKTSECATSILEVEPEQLVSQAKRYLGVTSEEAIMIKRESKHVFAMNGNRFKAPDGREVSAEEVAATYLKKVKKLCPASTIHAVITVPAHFGDSQRQATKDAAEIAGLKVLQLMNEPTAATIPYSEQIPLYAKVATIDLGGGTLDISVMEKTEDGLVVRATAGDPHLGGYDIDELIVKWALAKYKKESSSFIAPNGATMSRLRLAARLCKEALSDNETAEVTVQYNETKKVSTTISITRQDFERLARPTITRLTTHLMDALQDANLDSREIDLIILAGGGSKMPLVSKVVREELPDSRILNNVNAHEAIALGAAAAAHLVGSRSTDLVPVREICTETLGIETEDHGFSAIIRKGQRIPATEERYYETATDFQSVVSISVYSGDNDKAPLNALLGVFLMHVLPMPRGELQLAVQFKMSIDGTLEVSSLPESSMEGDKRAQSR